MGHPFSLLGRENSKSKSEGDNADTEIFPATSKPAVTIGLTAVPAGRHMPGNYAQWPCTFYNAARDPIPNPALLRNMKPDGSRLDQDEGKA
jgi:hypothetical protein